MDNNIEINHIGPDYLEMLRDFYSECETERCKEQGADIKVIRPRSISHWVVFQFQSDICKSRVDQYGCSHDCFIYIPKLEQIEEQIIVIELKSKHGLLKGIIQLRNGVRVLERDIRSKFQLSSCSLKIQIILGCKGSKEVTLTKKRLIFEKIKFFDQPYVIKLVNSDRRNSIAVEPLIYS